MTDTDAAHAIGYGKPPKRTQFTKGQSGNPKGRPKGSQNFATLLHKIGRQRVRVTENGGSRHISKFEATMLQLTNKAASGDLKAIRELLCWIRSLEDSEQTAIPSPVLQEGDNAVMASIVERIRQSENPMSDNVTDPAATDPPPNEEEKQRSFPMPNMNSSCVAI
jgi:hypothetical protein